MTVRETQSSNNSLINTCGYCSCYNTRYVASWLYYSVDNLSGKADCLCTVLKYNDPW